MARPCWCRNRSTPLSCSRLRSFAVSVLQDVARPYERNQRVTKRKPFHATRTQHGSLFFVRATVPRQPYPALGLTKPFSSSTKSPGNEPVLPLPLIVGRHSRRDLTLIGRKPGPSHEASNIRNCSRYPSHCCNHHAVVAVTFDRASCRRYSHRSLQEFPQPDRSKSFRTIALLTMGLSLH